MEKYYLTGAGVAMHDRKQKFVQDVFVYISKICEEKLSDYKVYDERVYDVLGVGKKDLLVVLKKITHALPEFIYLNELSDLYSEVMEYLAKEYILFQCQEDIEDPYFANNLANFIYEINASINQNYNFY